MKYGRCEHWCPHGRLTGHVWTHEKRSDCTKIYKASCPKHAKTPTDAGEDRRARFRAFKCRLGIHRWFKPWDRSNVHVCNDCRKWEVLR